MTFEFGSWTFRLFQVLAKLKRLRGGPLDIFGYTKERKIERQLIVDYRAQIEDLLPKLSDKNRQFANAIARLPSDIRGFGPVKDEAIKKAQEKQQDLMTQFVNAKAPSKSEQKTSA